MSECAPWLKAQGLGHEVRKRTGLGGRPLRLLDAPWQTLPVHPPACLQTKLSDEHQLDAMTRARQLAVENGLATARLLAKAR